MPSRDAMMTLLGALALGALMVIGMYALTPEASRPALLDKMQLLAPAFVVAIPAFLAWLRGEQTRTDAAATREDVAAVRTQTNGELDQRITAALDAQTAQIRDQLTAAGVLPPDRSTPGAGGREPGPPAPPLTLGGGR